MLEQLGWEFAISLIPICITEAELFGLSKSIQKSFIIQDKHAASTETLDFSVSLTSSFSLNVFYFLLL